MNQTNHRYDAVVVGSGPNGLAAAITLAEAGKSVVVLEAADTPGGGLRSAELTRPGFIHDICAAIHPLALASPFFRRLDLSAHGLTWVHPPAPLAHPLDDEPAVLFDRSLSRTAEGLAQDRDAYMNMFKAPVNNWDKIISDLLRPLGIPSHPFLMMKLGPLLIRSAISTAKARFKGHRARALFAGNSAHSIMPLDRLSTAAFGIMLGMLGHGVGWPIVKGGSKNFATALESILKTHGGEIRTRAHVESIEDIPPSKAIFLDLAPRNIAKIKGLEFPNHYRDQLLSHKHGPGVFKIDWALDDPIPWKDPDCLRAGTLHIGGTLEEIAESEAAAWTEKPSGKPFVLLSQPSLFDKTRAPEGKHTAWAYCHVPNGCRLDMTGRIENQIERFAPKFTDRIIERHIMFPSDMRAHNPNYIGGDIAGGAQGLKQLFIKPLGSWTPYVTPLKNVYICSSSMPPGAGAHGLCGRLAAKTHLKGE